MIYWFILCLVLFVSVLIYELLENNNHKRFVVFFIALILSYFSGFRDGLGHDYNNYKFVIEEVGRNFRTLEPGYTLLVKLASSQYFSYTSFFVFFAFFTNFLIIYSYSKYRLFYLSIIAYVLFSVLYFGSFNLVRQFFAAAILLFASKYVVEGFFFRYLFMVLIASLFHFSAIFLLGLYFLRGKKLELAPACVVLGLCVIVPYIIDLKGLIVSLLSGVGYDHYLSADESFNFGLLHLYFNILFFYMMIIIDKARMNLKDRYIVWMFFLCLIFYNLMPVYFYFYRVSIYFLVYFPLFLILPVYLRFQKAHIVLSIVASVAIFIYFIYSSKDNLKVVPNSIKSVLSIF